VSASQGPDAWQLFERGASGYEAWYSTRRGRRADLAERALLERLLARFATAQSALDVGCGTGHFTRWLAGRLPKVIGLDRAPAMLRQARRLDPRVRLIEGDAHHLPLRDRAVDLSLLLFTLEFVDRPAGVLAEAIRVSRRGMVAVTLNRWSLGGLSRRWGSDALRPVLGHAVDFTLSSLRASISAAAGPRLRTLRWASTLLGGETTVPMHLPLGDVIGIAIELAA